MNTCILFNDIDDSIGHLAGGKAYSLGKLQRIGMNVPNGFVVLSPIFESFVRDNGLYETIRALLEQTNYGDAKSIKNTSTEIQNKILEAELKDEIKTHIIDRFDELQVPFVAVRSSATAEDGKDDAWAGQLTTYLNTSRENLIQNIYQCWASLFSPRALYYRYKKGLHQEDIWVSVVVQSMLQSEISGVAFSINPVTYDDHKLIIEAISGLGEALVSGAVVPDRYIVDKKHLFILDKSISLQSKRLRCHTEESILWEEAFIEEQKLSDENILELSKMIITLEETYGYPVDVEWAFHNGKLYTLQCRPITTLRKG